MQNITATLIGIEEAKLAVPNQRLYCLYDMREIEGKIEDVERDEVIEEETD